MKIVITRKIERPTEEVYHFLVDPENLRLWLTDYVRMERISGDRVSVGSQNKHIYKNRGRIVAFIEEVTDQETNQLFASILRRSSMEMTVRNELFPLSSATTRLVVTAELNPRNFVYRILLPLSKKRIFRRQEANIDRLKEVIETLGKELT